MNEKTFERKLETSLRGRFIVCACCGRYGSKITLHKDETAQVWLCQDFPQCYEIGDSKAIASVLE